MIKAAFEVIAFFIEHPAACALVAAAFTGLLFSRHLWKFEKVIVAIAAGLWWLWLLFEMSHRGTTAIRVDLLILAPIILVAGVAGACVLIIFVARAGGWAKGPT